jgi:anaerobic selenocysteine-containing dehydrogenase
MIRQLGDRPTLQVHPEDARARRIADGARVRVYNDRGWIELEATLDHGIKRGCVSVTNGWWISEGGTVNFLSAARETDMGYGAAFHENRVEVETVGDAE